MPLLGLPRFRPSPAVHLGQLEFPEPPNPVGRHRPVRNPAINRVPGNTEVNADLLYRRPALHRRGPIRARSCGHNLLIVAKSAQDCTPNALMLPKCDRARTHPNRPIREVLHPPGSKQRFAHAVTITILRAPRQSSTLASRKGVQEPCPQVKRLPQFTRWSSI